MTEQDKILQNALDQFWKAQTVLDEEGYLTPNGYGGHKPHPALAWQKQAFDMLYKLLPKNIKADVSIDDLLKRPEDKWEQR